MNYLIGFGLSGLGFIENFPLNNITILEKNNYYGGHAYSHEFNGFFFDEGAHILHTNDKKFLNKFLKRNSFNEKKSKVLNFKENKWFDYPVQSNLFKVNNGIDYLISFLTRKDKKINNFDDWCQVNYGKKISNDFYKLYTKKYWNKNQEDLDISWIKGRIINPDESKIILNTFFDRGLNDAAFNFFKYPISGGFYNFFKSSFEKYSNIAKTNIKIDYIDKKNKKIFYDNKIFEYEKIFSTIPLPEYLNILDFPKRISSLIRKLEYTSLHSINIIIKKKKFIHNFDWTYIYDKNIEISRVTILNNISQNQKNSVIGIQAEIFKHNQFKGTIDYKSQILKLLKILKINKNDLVDYNIKKIKYSYIISKKTNQNCVKEIKSYLHKFDIYPFGLYGDWHYYWSDQSYNKGKEFAIKFKC